MSGFNPDDIADLERIFARTVEDSENGYIVEFHISKLAAKEMVEEWIEGLMGNRAAIKSWMHNYSYIVESIMEQLQADD
jgi:hypothetical protein